MERLKTRITGVFITLTLAFLLCAVSLLLPSNTDTAYAKTADGSTMLAFTSDTHNQSNNTAANRLGTWINTVQTQYNGTIDAFAFGGDMADASASASNYWTYTQADMKQLTDRNVTGVYTTGNHEHSPGQYSASSTNSTQQAFKIGAQGAEGDNYRIYCLGSSSSSQSYSASQISALESYLNSVDNSKPIFIITHFPLHYYNSNSGSGWSWGGRSTGNADQVIDKLNAAVNNGKKIVFLWGHNHTLSDTFYDEIYKPGASIPYSDSASKTIQFYYGGAGCMSDGDYSSGSASVKGKGLVVLIDSNNNLTFTYHNASGSDVTEGGSFTEQTVPITGIAITAPNGQTVKTGKTLQLGISKTPSNATVKTQSWSSSNTNVATVNNNGLVTGVNAGTATITVTASDGTRATVTGNIQIIVEQSDPSATVNYVQTDTLEAGKEYIIASNNTGSVYVLSNEANGSRLLKGIQATVSNGTLTLTEDEAAKAEFTTVANSGSSQGGLWLKNDGKYLYTNSANGLAVNNDQTNSDNSAKSWHYKADGKNLLWYFKDDSTDGYNDTSSTYKYYLELSGSNFTDNHVSTTSLANSSTPKMYLFTKSAGTAAVTGVSVNPTSLNLSVGKTSTLTATVSPSDAANKAVTWSSSAPGVATVNNGVVTAVGTGSAVITVTTVDGGKTATCNVTVTPSTEDQYVLATSIKDGGEYLIVNTSATGSAYALKNPGGSSNGTAPQAASVTIQSGSVIYTDNESIVWTASVNQGASVSNTFNLRNDGDYLEGKSGNLRSYNTQQYPTRAWNYDGTYLQFLGGSYTYELYYENGFTARSFNSGNPSHPVYIFEKVIEQVGVTGVTLDKSSMSLSAGKTGTLNATVSPSNATNKAVIWSSSAPGVATVDSNGTVTAVGTGSAIITVTTVDGGKTASCTVTVSTQATVSYVQTDTLVAGKTYIIASNNTGSVYVLSNEANGSRKLKGISTTVSNGKITLTDDEAAKAEFTTVANSGSSQGGLWLKNDGKYLYTNSANGLAVNSDQTNSDNSAKSWHYKADGKYLLWYFKDDSTDGYNDTSQTYKYYLELSGSDFTDNHVSTTNLANSNTPKIYLFTEDDSHAHTYGQPTWNWAADYSSATATFTCTAGDDTQVITASAPVETVVTAATCTDNKVASYTATVTFNGATYTNATGNVTVANSSLGHSYGAWTVTTQPTCTTAGVETRTCARCGATETREVAALGHTMTAHAAVAATCTEGGNSAYWSCSVCGKYFSDAQGTTEIAEGSWVIAALDHNWGEPSASTPATCTEDGVETVTCKRCGLTETHVIPALGHDWGEPSSLTPATCTKAGEETVTCKRCGLTETHPIPALGHDWGEPTWTWATDFSSARADFTCARCGNSASSTDKHPVLGADGKTYTAEVIGPDNETYTDTATINDTNVITAPDVSDPVDMVYTGNSLTQTIVVTVAGKVLEEGVDYLLAFRNADAEVTGNNTATAQIVVTGQGDYTGSVVKEFTITRKPCNVKSLWASQHDVGKVLFKWTKESNFNPKGWMVKYRTKKIGAGNWSGWTEKSFSASTYQFWCPVPVNYVVEIHAKAKGDSTYSTGIITTPAGGKYQAMKYVYVKNVLTGKRLTSDTLTLSPGGIIILAPDYEYPVADYNKRPRLYPTQALWDLDAAGKELLTIYKPDGTQYTAGMIDGSATISANKDKTGTAKLTCRAPNGRTKTLTIVVK